MQANAHLNHARFARGFTLVELLVVIAIIAVLAALIFPSLSRAKQRAYQVGCISNLRQTGVALQLWLGDNGDLLPPGEAGLSEGWGLYAGQKALYGPSDGGNSKYRLVYYLATYLGSPAPDANKDFFCKIFSCPGNLVYNQDLPGGTTNFTSYRSVTPANTSLGGQGYCGFTNWGPFGFAAGSWMQPSHKITDISQVTPLSQAWAMVDVDAVGDPGLAGIPDYIVAPEPVHRKVRNYLWFDSHVSGEPVSAAPDGNYLYPN